MERNRRKILKQAFIGAILFIVVGMFYIFFIGTNKTIATNDSNNKEGFKVVSKLPTVRSLTPGTVTIQQGNLIAYVSQKYTLDTSIGNYRTNYGIGEKVVLEAQFDKVINNINNVQLTIKFGTNGAEHVLTPTGFVSNSSSVLKFEYVLQENVDNGELDVKALTGSVTDSNNNTIQIGMPTTGVQYSQSSTITADTMNPNYSTYSIELNGTGVGEEALIVLNGNEKLYYKDENNRITTLTASNLKPYVKVGNYQGKGTTYDYRVSEDTTSISYRYVIAEGDNGTLFVGDYKVCDIAGNETKTLKPSEETITTKETPYVKRVTFEDNGIRNADDDFHYCNAGKVISVTVEYNEDIYGINTANTTNTFVQLRIGGQPRYAGLANIVNSRTLKFSYVVAEGDNGFVIAEIPQGIVTDRVGHPSVYAKTVGEDVYTESPLPDWAIVADNDIVVDTIAPVYTLSVNSNEKKIYGIGKSLDIKVTANEEVNNATNKIKFGKNGIVRDITSLTTDHWSTIRNYQYTVQTGDNDRLIFLSDLEDKAGNKAKAASEQYYYSYSCYADTTGPTVTITPDTSFTYTNLSNIKYNITTEDNSEYFYCIDMPIVGETEYGVKANTFTIDDIVVSNGTILSSTVDNKGNITSIDVAASGNGKQIVYIKANSFEDCADPANTNANYAMCDQITIDTTAPSISNISCEPNHWTNGDVKVTCFATDDQSEENLVYHMKDDSTVHNDYELGNETIVSENCNVTFKVTDSAGNNSERGIYVNNIDKSNPILQAEYNEEDSIIEITARDELSGIESVEVNGEAVTLSNGKFDYRVLKNGNYIVTATDKAGNSVTREIEVNNIDNEPPVIRDIQINTLEWTNHNVTLTCYATDNNGEDNITYYYAKGTEILRI